jgi:FAD/FMN-containing dehydrogenase
MSMETIERPAAATPLLNDVHSGLNPTRVSRVLRPRSLLDLVRIVRTVAGRGHQLSISGGRHAMGGQQFGAGTINLDTRALRRVLDFDPVCGTVEAEAGIMWPQLVAALHSLQPGDPHPWTIIQKQTGADRMTLGGSLSANIHGRGLTMPPLVADIEHFTLVDAAGRTRRVSRRENSDLFRLAIGGYGLFGALYSIRLRLARRQLLRRRVVMTTADEACDLFRARIAEGYSYGDFQFAIDPASDDFLRAGVMSCYRSEPDQSSQSIPADQRILTGADWTRLLTLAHQDKRRAFAEYTAHYLKTDGQLYHSDAAQLGVYVDGYHREIDGDGPPGGEMISELYVPPESLGAFMTRAAAALRKTAANVIYGTVRLVRADLETILAWARRDWACIVLNLCTPRTPEGIACSGRAFRAVIDAALEFGGSFYLAYHRFARRDQIEAAHPKFRNFLWFKRKADPAEVFVSDWYRHYVAMFQESEPCVPIDPAPPPRSSPPAACS